MSTTLDSPVFALRHVVPGSTPRSRFGISLGLHAMLLAILCWHWQAARLAGPPREASLSVVFEAPAETTRDLPQVAVASPMAPVLPPRLSAPAAVTMTMAARPSPSSPAPRRATATGMSHAAPAATHPAAPQPAGAPSRVAQAPRVTPDRAAPSGAQPDSAALGAFENKIQSAVQLAAIYPPAARMQRRQGRARVRFTYADGHAGMATLMISSDSQTLDRAAMDAVQRAQLPAPPSQISMHKLDMLVWVSFSLASATD
jgi:TonB family protein